MCICGRRGLCLSNCIPRYICTCGRRGRRPSNRFRDNYAIRITLLHLYPRAPRPVPLQIHSTLHVYLRPALRRNRLHHGWALIVYTHLNRLRSCVWSLFLRLFYDGFSWFRFIVIVEARSPFEIESYPIGYDLWGNHIKTFRYQKTSFCLCSDST